MYSSGSESGYVGSSGMYSSLAIGICSVITVPKGSPFQHKWPSKAHTSIHSRSKRGGGFESGVTTVRYEVGQGFPVARTSCVWPPELMVSTRPSKLKVITTPSPFSSQEISSVRLHRRGRWVPSDKVLAHSGRNHLGGLGGLRSSS